MASCVAYGCTNRAGKKIPGITFHRFPSNPQLKAAWITAVKRKDWLPTPYSRLCSAHFPDDLFDRSMTRVLLRENAVPSIFPAFPANYRKNSLKKNKLIVSSNSSTMGFANASGIDNLTLLTQKISQPSSSKSPINKIPNLLESSGNNSENEMSACKRVCELHFVDSDFVKTVNVFDSKTGKRTEYALDQIRLKKDAVPSVFPEILEHHPRTVSLHGHGKRKEMRDDDEDLDLSDNTAITPDILQINSKSAFNNWEKDEISALIALYELETCLYDKKDKNYYNKDERNNAFDRIQQVMTYIRPTCTLNQVKRKILNLRNLYATERLFKEKSIRNGFSTEDTYEPSLWCFRLLQFLDEHIVQTERRRYKKLLIENEAKKDIFEDKQSFQDSFETSTLSEKQNVSGESDGDQDVENNRMMKIAEVISENNKKNATEEISADKDEEHEMLITSSEAVIEGQEDEYNNEPDNYHCESSEDDHQNCQNNEASGLDGENSNNSDRLNEPCRRKKWRLDNSVSTSKKFKTEKKCDKEDIFGRYVSGEMKTLRHNPLLYLKTKQSILKILTEANFKLINSES